jgi:hypothetical protein
MGDLPQAGISTESKASLMKEKGFVKEIIHNLNPQGFSVK